MPTNLGSWLIFIIGFSAAITVVLFILIALVLTFRITLNKQTAEELQQYTEAHKNDPVSEVDEIYYGEGSAKIYAIPIFNVIYTLWIFINVTFLWNRSKFDFYRALK